eukprot:TRINITY_DN6388_c0_g1_i4.p1 TRINITY_DN6388_c0_g1~~TRINITY_DN6388_c0_g1_i4.p1  ORF type:complete len:438 (+),score=50.45 TRINITY_DN6388_c0_g1_i4:67-1314(+)
MVCAREAGVAVAVSTILSFAYNGPIDACLFILAMFGILLMSPQAMQHSSWFSFRRQKAEASKWFSMKSSRTKSSQEIVAEDAEEDKYKGVRPAVRIQNLQRGYHAFGIERGIEKFLDESFPTSEDEEQAGVFARKIKDAISSRCPDMTVEAFPCSKLVSGHIVHVPEILVNVTVGVEKLVHQLTDSARGSQKNDQLFSQQSNMKKIGLRLLAQELISMGIADRYNPRFAGEIPSVRMHHGYGAAQLTFVLFINYAVPSHTSALLIEMGCRCPNGAKLAYFVSKWARDRGIAFESKGHLGQYAWHVLVSTFFQACSSETMLPTPSVRSLFREFISYYSTGSDGGRLIEEQIARYGSPLIQDPFSSANLGVAMSREGSQRFFEEFSRARRLLDDADSTLAQLLEHWTPATTAAKSSM